MCAGLPDVESPFSGLGQRVHAYHAMLAEGATVPADASPEEADTAKWLWGKTCELRDSVLFGAETLLIEERLWLHDGIAKIFSGQPDIAFALGNRALVIDCKAIQWGEHDDAPDNHQLLSLAVLVDSNYGPFEEVTVAINQTYQQPVLCVYDRIALDAVDVLLRGQLKATTAPDAPRKAGDWCNYCKGQARCTEFKSRLARVTDTQLMPSSSDEARTYTAEEVADFLLFCKSVIGPATKGVAWAQAMAERIKEENPADFERCFEMDVTEGKDLIQDLPTVLGRMMAHGVSQEDFMRCLVARKHDSTTNQEPGLSGVLARALTLKPKGKENLGKLDGCIAGCVKEGAKKFVPVVKDSYAAIANGGRLS